MDPYRVLGLEPGASQADVKRAYRRLAKALHPDAAGERALPAFLELQEAYERLTGTKVRTVRPTTGPSPSASTAGQPFREPWRADPARARAAREQARTRRPWPGATTGSTGRAQAAGGAPDASSSSGAAAGSNRGSTPGGTARAPRPPAAGARRARPEAGSGEAPSAADAGTGQRRTDGGRPRRKSSRKATLGSTSYDEARDPADPRWAGASWYGPTTGEYWIVNPREYADPRKHGPGYRSRGRAAGPDDAGDDVGDTPPHPPEGVAPPEQPTATAADELRARETVRPRRPAADRGTAG
ncbi:MAG TPA: DnaJ domain-containing protein, partial [Candidatus Acidoferrales bacterium]|nr:DnaJ domain-containing protein [Candidatus Acidoferrales bacterium]